MVISPSCLRAYLIFGDIEDKLDVLRVECTKCARKGRHYPSPNLLDKIPSPLDKYSAPNQNEGERNDMDQVDKDSLQYVLWCARIHVVDLLAQLRDDGEIPVVELRIARPPPREKKRIADPTKRCNHHRRIVAVCCPELGEFIQ
jgi:hypothetical protein